MSVPIAPEKYNARDQNETRAEIKRELDRRHKRGVDLELATERFILRSPNGDRWSVVVSDAGVLSAVAV